MGFWGSLLRGHHQSGNLFTDNLFAPSMTEKQEIDSGMQRQISKNWHGKKLENELGKEGKLHEQANHRREN